MNNIVKKNRILTTAGLCSKNAIQLKGYFQIMINTLIDNWICEDNFVENHVCFVRDDYVDKLSESTKKKCGNIVIINMSRNSYNYNYRYQLSTPITAKKVEYILNKISKEVEYNHIPHELDEIYNSFDKFKSTVNSFFGNEQTHTTQTLQSKRQKVFINLSQKIKVKDAIANKIIFIGSPGAGKSKIIETSKKLSSSNSNDSNIISTQNKVGIDYSEIELHNSIKFTLIGVPDQIKLDFIWDIVGKKISAFVIVLDMSRPELFEYLKYYLRMIQSEVDQNTDIYCALTHSDKFNKNPEDIKLKIINEFSSITNVFILDCRISQDVFIMLSSIYNGSILTHEKEQSAG